MTGTADSFGAGRAGDGPGASLGKIKDGSEGEGGVREGDDAGEGNATGAGGGEGKSDGDN